MKYRHTIYACYLGYITQAVINNFAPLLFLIFHEGFGIELGKITFLITANFCVQLIVGLLAAVVFPIAMITGCMKLGKKKV